ncbi:hypothetical protein VTH82DRAFT_3076 [Thermothelomyces myriococcoides]
MRFTSIALFLAGAVPTVLADCNHPSAPPDYGEIALYSGKDCTGSYYNAYALGYCQNSPSFGACSAITRPGVVCDVYLGNDCTSHRATIDSTGWRNLCGAVPDLIESVRCYQV